MDLKTSDSNESLRKITNSRWQVKKKSSLVKPLFQILCPFKFFQIFPNFLTIEVKYDICVDLGKGESHRTAPSDLKG